MKQMNLIPRDRQKNEAIVSRIETKILGVVLAVLMLLVCWQMTAVFRYQFSISSKKKLIDSLAPQVKEQQKAYETVHSRRMNIDEQRERLVKRLALLKNAEKQGRDYSTVIHRLGQLVPPSISLMHISLKDSDFLLKGAAVKNMSVTDLMAEMDRSEYFRQTRFNYLQKEIDQDKNEVVVFELMSQLGSD